jgi:probable F420-dependent oxidoreductase
VRGGGVSKDLPLVGVGLPVFGPHASPQAVATIARAAEQLGYHSVSTGERLLLPAVPEWTNDFGLPESAPYDALESLTWVAALTERVRLVTGVVNSLFHPPVVLARRFATLDQLSGGRVDVGIANGWMPEEFAAVGVSPRRRGRGFESHLAAMRACWGPDPVALDDRFYPIAPSNIAPKPVNGRPPVLIGGLAPAALARAARLGDGVILGFRDWDNTCEQIAGYRDAGGSGRVVLRAGPMPGLDTWTPDRVAQDLADAAAVGVEEVLWDLNIIELGIDEQLEAMEALAPFLAR